MSDGPSDDAAVSRLADKVLDKTEGLKKALDAAEEGTRGMRPELGHLLQRMNNILGPSWEIRRVR